MRHRLTAATIVSAALAAGGAEAQVRLVEAGIICPRPVTGELIDAPGTEAGHIRRIDEETAFDLLERTVPVMDEISFGLRIALKPGLPTQAVTMVVTHPPMGSRAVVRQEWDDLLLPGSDSLNLFTFEMPHEKVPGPWIFSVEVDGRAVVQVPFEITESDGRGAVEETCFQFLS